MKPRTDLQKNYLLPLSGLWLYSIFTPTIDADKACHPLYPLVRDCLFLNKKKKKSQKVSVLDDLTKKIQNSLTRRCHFKYFVYLFITARYSMTRHGLIYSPSVRICLFFENDIETRESRLRTWLPDKRNKLFLISNLSITTRYDMARHGLMYSILYRSLVLWNVE